MTLDARLALIGYALVTAGYLAGWLRRPVALALACACTYPTTAWLVPMLRPHRYDEALVAADRWLLGVDPAQWLDAVVHPALTGALTIAYVCVWVPPVLLCATCPGARRDFLAALVLAHYLGYVGYLLLPAAGPWSAGPHRFRVPLGDNVLLTWIRDHATGVDAFPSLHTAVAVLTLLFAWRDCRQVFWRLLPLGLAICAATLYLRWHYLTDVLGGVLLAVACRWLVPRLLALRVGRVQPG